MSATNSPSRKPVSPKSITFTMRRIHRVLGYLVAGIMMVYGLTGITLLFRTTDFMKHSSHVETTLAPGLSAKELGDELKIKNLQVTQENADEIRFDTGVYDVKSGKVEYEKKEVVQPLRQMINFHKMSPLKSGIITAVNTCFAAILFLLALTSLFMFKPQLPMFRTNMIIFGIGCVVAALVIIFA